MSSDSCVLQELEIQEAVDKPSLKKGKIMDLKPEDAVAKCTFHPTGVKLVSTWLCGIILNCLVTMRNGIYAPFVRRPK